MTTPHPTCPICGRTIGTSIDQTDYLIHAFCRNEQCGARLLVGKGDSTQQAIDHFIGLTLRLNDRKARAR